MSVVDTMSVVMSIVIGPMSVVIGPMSIVVGSNWTGVGGWYSVGSNVGSGWTSVSGWYSVGCSVDNVISNYDINWTNVSSNCDRLPEQ